LSALDTEKWQFQLVFLESKVLVPKSAKDYKTSIFSFDTKKIHAFNQIDLHKQADEMIYSTLTSSTMTASKMQASLNNIHTHLKMERISSLAKDTRIKALEDLVFKLGYDPSNIKVAEEMIKNKNVDIQALRKQF